MRSIAYLATVALLIAGGCDRGEPADAPGQQPGEQFHAGEHAEDYHSGNWPDEPRRIVSMAPNTTELLFELNLGDRVVATTRYCDWPPEQTDELPTIGGMLDPDYEAILAAEPDVVIGAVDGADHEIAERLDRADIAYGFVPMDDTDSVQRGIEQLGDWLGVEQQARRLVEQFRNDLDDASSRTREHLHDDTTALLVLDRDPVIAAGAGSFGHDLLEHAGLDNALADSQTDYPMLDLEQLLVLNPDLIVDVTIGADDQTARAFWEDFDTLSAVEGDRVIHLDDPVMLRPGPRIPRAVEKLGEAVADSR